MVYNTCQPSLPRGERHAPRPIRPLPPGISTHAPTRGATRGFPEQAVSIPNFNPRSHEGSDHLQARYAEIVDISTHAPTRGATGQVLAGTRVPDISTHAPTRGATPSTMSIFNSVSSFQPTLPRGERHSSRCFGVRPADFNPRSHEGSDPVKPQNVCTMWISTHAPTRGATWSLPKLKMPHPFQPTLPRGERQAD